MKDLIFGILSWWVIFIERSSFWPRVFGLMFLFGCLLAAGWAFAWAAYNIAGIVADTLGPQGVVVAFFVACLFAISFVMAWCFEKEE